MSHRQVGSEPILALRRGAAAGLPGQRNHRASRLASRQHWVSPRKAVVSIFDEPKIDSHNHVFDPAVGLVKCSRQRGP
jgi:hypothetical protein